MDQTNSSGWARERATANPFKNAPLYTSYDDIVNQLYEIFVVKMGLVQNISLEVNPDNGQPTLNFIIPAGSPFPEVLQYQEVQGIPIRYTRY
jgi:hypothetical protein